MRIPEDCETPDSKFRDYLVVFQRESDKSKYLQQLGYTQDNWEELRDIIRNECVGKDAGLHKVNVNGTFYELDIELRGSNEKKLWVKTIWLEDNVSNAFRFITLVPIAKGNTR